MEYDNNDINYIVNPPTMNVHRGLMVLATKQIHLPLCSGVVALHGIGAGLSFQVASNGKKESLQHGHAHTTAPVSHLWNDVHDPPICLGIVALYIPQCLVF